MERCPVKKLLPAFLVVGLAISTVTAYGADTVLRTTPCRLFDSRNIGTGDKIISATIETLSDAGTAQGGESNCDVPSTAVGVVLNLTAFQPNSGGWARLWATGEPEPLSTSINAFSGAGNEATGLIVATGTGGEISLTSSIAGSHYIIDLAGYLEEGPTFPFHEIVLSNQQIGDVVYLFVQGHVAPFTCEEPYVDPNSCLVMVQGSEIVGTAHITRDSSKYVANVIHTFSEE